MPTAGTMSLIRMMIIVTVITFGGIMTIRKENGIEEDNKDSNFMTMTILIQ